jgi:hypothetical protein
MSIVGVRCDGKVWPGPRWNSIDRVLVRYIAWDGERPATSGPYFSDRLVQLVCRARRDSDGHPCAGKGPRNLTPDAAPAAGHDRHLTVQRTL